MEGCPPVPEPPTETSPTSAECAADSTLEGCPPVPEPPTETSPTSAECAADSTLEGCPPVPEPPTKHHLHLQNVQQILLWKVVLQFLNHLHHL